MGSEDKCFPQKWPCPPGEGGGVGGIGSSITGLGPVVVQSIPDNTVTVVDIASVTISDPSEDLTFNFVTNRLLVGRPMRLLVVTNWAGESNAAGVWRMRVFSIVNAVRTQVTITWERSADEANGESESQIVVITTAGTELEWETFQNSGVALNISVFVPAVVEV